MAKPLLQALNLLVYLLYPLAVYLLLDRVSIRLMGAFFLLFILKDVVLKLAKDRGSLVTVLIQAGGCALLVLLASLFNSRAYLQHLPVFISLFLLATFALSLIRPPPMVERYARALNPDLSLEEAAYCRNVTIVWMAFFVANAAVVVMINIFLSFEAWVLYAGLLSYLLMGLLFSMEFIYRRHRFHGFTDSPIDRLLRRILVR